MRTSTGEDNNSNYYKDNAAGVLCADDLQLAGSYLSVFIIPTGDQWSQLVREATFSSQYVQKILDIGLDGVMGNMSASMTRLALTKSNDTVIGTIH